MQLQIISIHRDRISLLSLQSLYISLYRTVSFRSFNFFPLAFRPFFVSHPSILGLIKSIRNPGVGLFPIFPISKNLILHFFFNNNHSFIPLFFIFFFFFLYVSSSYFVARIYPEGFDGIDIYNVVQSSSYDVSRSSMNSIQCVNTRFETPFRIERVLRFSMESIHPPLRSM